MEIDGSQLEILAVLGRMMAISGCCYSVLAVLAGF
jgi:hypothetical protein